MSQELIEKFKLHEQNFNDLDPQRRAREALSVDSVDMSPKLVWLLAGRVKSTAIYEMKHI